MVRILRGLKIHLSFQEYLDWNFRRQQYTYHLLNNNQLVSWKNLFCSFCSTWIDFLIVILPHHWNHFFEWGVFFIREGSKCFLLFTRLLFQNWYFVCYIHWLIRKIHLYLFDKWIILNLIKKWLRGWLRFSFYN